MTGREGEHCFWKRREHVCSAGGERWLERKYKAQNTCQQSGKQAESVPRTMKPFERLREASHMCAHYEYYCGYSVMNRKEVIKTRRKMAENLREKRRWHPEEDSGNVVRERSRNSRGHLRHLGGKMT